MFAEILFSFSEAIVENKRNSFGGSLGFVLAAAGSAVGLGNIWRFPYLAAKDGGGMFIAIYLLLSLTVGFALLTTDISIGRKTKQGPLTAYSRLKNGWGFLGFLSCLIPQLILPYYCAIGGWVLKYFLAYLTGGGVSEAADVYYTSFISDISQPIIMMLVFFSAVLFIILLGVNKGIETLSKVLMPLLMLLVIGIAVFSLTMKYTDADGTVRTGLQGLKILFVPDFSNLTIKEFFNVLVDAMGQLFFSLSIAMGTMVAYGSYVPDNTNLAKSINKIEIFDTVVAILAGIMIIPAVYTFMGSQGMSAYGPGLMFVMLPRVFFEMGAIGNVVGCLFFAMVFFAALTSGVSIMEAVVSSLMDAFNMSRRKAAVIEGIIAVTGGVIVCFGYNKLYFTAVLPNDTEAQILEIFDYISNNVLMPLAAIFTCILIGWVVKPETVIDEIEKTGVKMGRKRLYIVIIKYIAPVLLIILFLKSIGILNMI